MEPRIATIALVLFALGFAGCDLLDVQNPNTLQESQLGDPTSSQAMASGLKGSAARAFGYQLAPYGMASDELTWIGSRDAWQQLDFGQISNPNNEFSDLAFPYLAEANWHAGEYISRMKAFQQEGTLPSADILVETYLYGAIVKTSIADVFNDYAVGANKREGGVRVSTTDSTMQSFYDTALRWVLAAQDLNAGLDEPVFQAELKAMEARIRFSRSLWPHLQPADGGISTGEDALVANQAAATAAAEALSLMSGLESSYQYELPIPASASFDSYVAGQVNNRQEMVVSDAYVSRNPDDGTFDSVSFEDPVDEEIHPYVQDIVTNRYSSSGNAAADVVAVSAREMNLIRAEVALANGDDSGFDRAINDLRTINGLSSYDGPAADQISRVDLLASARKANLLFQLRRLKDLYRFEERTPFWQSGSDAVARPGTFFPITATEISSNPNISRLE
jgi:hypothetical protein